MEQALRAAGLLLLCLAACGDDGAATTSSSGTSSGAGGATTADVASSSASTTGATTGSAGTGGTGGIADIDKSENCASTFGNGLTSAFGRVDGTVLAIVKPVDQQCAMPNNDHVVLEVTMFGEVYRIVINVLSTQGNPNVFFLETSHPMIGMPWAEGWHPNVSLDYVNMLGVHSTDFAEMSETPLANLVTDDIQLGDKISVYATSSGGSSAHLVHRNGSNHDGAIVIDPEGAAPRWLLFHFDEQTF